MEEEAQPTTRLGALFRKTAEAGSGSRSRVAALAPRVKPRGDHPSHQARQKCVHVAPSVMREWTSLSTYVVPY